MEEAFGEKFSGCILGYDLGFWCIWNEGELKVRVKLGQSDGGVGVRPRTGEIKVRMHH